MSNINMKSTALENTPAYILKQKEELKKQKELEEANRKRKLEARQSCIFYPIEENSDYKVNPLDEFKTGWDLFMTFILIFSSFVIPYRVAFKDEVDDTRAWVIINSLIDTSFGFDIIVVFNTAFYDENFKIVENRKEIAIKYMKGWFFIDLFAIIPFDLILGSSADFN